MTPAVEVPVVWLDDGHAGEPSAPLLDAWARARGIRLVGFAADARRPLAYPDDAATAVEAALARARDATAALDRELAERAVDDAEATLTSHPELPQAAWLLAEVLRARALQATTLRPRDPERAGAALREARGLDGGRVAGLGEPPAQAPTLVDFELASDGLDKTAELRVDGKPALAGRVRLSVGRHHVLLLVARRPVWASWVDAREGGRLAVPSLRTPCGLHDLAGVAASAGRVVVPGGVSCREWAAVRATATGLLVARCSREVCGPLVEWRVRLPDSPLVPHYEDRSFPSWAAWGAAGTVALVLTGVVLVASGALETAPQTTRFSYGGLFTR